MMVGLGDGSVSLRLLRDLNHHLGQRLHARRWPPLGTDW